MSVQFQCPWCGADTLVRGSTSVSWKMRMPCDLCGREMQVSWDQSVAVGRAHANESLSRSEGVTLRSRAR